MLELNVKEFKFRYLLGYNNGFQHSNGARVDQQYLLAVK